VKFSEKSSTTSSYLVVDLVGACELLVQMTHLICRLVIAKSLIGSAFARQIPNSNQPLNRFTWLAVVGDQEQ
jgi:hypothetical protein